MREIEREREAERQRESKRLEHRTESRNVRNIRRSDGRGLGKKNRDRNI